MSHLVRAADCRNTKTPNGVMTTHASPTLGDTTALSLWEVRMTANATGPLHVFDSEQIWTVLDGRVSIAVNGSSETLEAGDTVVIPAGVERRISPVTDVRLLVCGYGNAVPQVPGEPGARATPAWIA